MAAYPEIGVEEAYFRLEEFQPVDVRAEHELRGPLGHLRGTISIPLDDLERRVAELPGRRPLLLVCRSGRRSGTACERLARLGVGPVANLTGGLIAWNRARLPIEQTDPSSLAELLERVVDWTAQVGPLSRSEAREVLAEPLRAVGASFERPAAAAVSRVIDFVEETLTEADTPPDLDLSVTSFRRALAVL